MLLSSDSLVNANTPGAPSFFPITNPTAGTALPGSEWPQNEKLPLLFTPITIGGMEFKNRLWTGPMCQYSAETVDGERGHLSKWHEIHLGGIAARGTGLVVIEATAVMENGGITPQCPGLWSDQQGKRLGEVIGVMKALGAKVGIQLAHAGRKGSTVAPWIGTSTIKPGMRSQIAPPGEAQGWEVSSRKSLPSLAARFLLIRNPECFLLQNVWAPSAIPFAEGYPMPYEMTLDQIEDLKQAWVRSTERADKAGEHLFFPSHSVACAPRTNTVTDWRGRRFLSGIDVIELHYAHGYLVQSFLSPLSNHRRDRYGGSLQNRMRLALEIVELVRATLDKNKPLFVRISATEWHPEGEKDVNGQWISWGIEQSKMFLQELLKRGVVLVDASSGGNDVRQKITVSPDYQVQFARALKESMDDNNKIHISA